MEHKLVENPLQLYNVDESAVPSKSRDNGSGGLDGTQAG